MIAILLTCVELFANFEVNTKSLGGKEVEVVQGDKSVPMRRGVQKVVYYNLTNKECKRDFAREPAEMRVLFMWEPHVVLKKMYQKKVHNHFGKVYTWDDDLVDGKKYFKFNYPVMRPMIEEVVPFAEKRLCVMVAGKHKSRREGELYSERLKMVELFERKPRGEFAFYGRGWRDPSPLYEGEIGDKIETIKRFRFCVCYENTSNRKGYITEKIFDCFAAGNVPIYWGATNVEEYIPKGCFIDRREFASDEEVYQYIKGMKEVAYDEYIREIRSFLGSDAAQAFSGKAFQKTFLEAVL